MYSRRAERLVRKKISKVLWLHTSINHTMRKRKVMVKMPRVAGRACRWEAGGAWPCGQNRTFRQAAKGEESSLRPLPHFSLSFLRAPFTTRYSTRTHISSTYIHTYRVTFPLLLPRPARVCALFYKKPAASLGQRFGDVLFSLDRQRVLRPSPQAQRLCVRLVRAFGTALGKVQAAIAGRSQTL
jgi:hypothetical protein